jgi:hypothetical protein
MVVLHALWYDGRMHRDHQTFLDAIAGKRKLSVRFFNRKVGEELVRTCAPLDFGPLRGSPDTAERYQLWDLEAKRKPFNVAVLDSEVVAMTLLDEHFDPSAIITWAFKPKAWRIARDWAEFS